MNIIKSEVNQYLGKRPETLKKRQILVKLAINSLLIAGTTSLTFNSTITTAQSQIADNLSQSDRLLEQMQKVLLQHLF